MLLISNLFFVFFSKIVFLLTIAKKRGKEILSFCLRNQFCLVICDKDALKNSPIIVRKIIFKVNIQFTSSINLILFDIGLLFGVICKSQKLVSESHFDK